MITSARKIHCLAKQEISSNLHKLLHRSTWRADCEEGQHLKLRICSIHLPHNSLTAELQKSGQKPGCHDTVTGVSKATLPQPEIAMLLGRGSIWLYNGSYFAITEINLVVLIYWRSGLHPHCNQHISVELAVAVSQSLQPGIQMFIQF